MVIRNSVPFPRQRSRVKALPISGCMQVGRSEVKREKELLPVRSSLERFPNGSVETLGGTVPNRYGIKISHDK